MPPETEVENSISEHIRSVYLTSVADYLRLSIQKWYAPKIHNRILSKMDWGKWLYVAVNDEPIQKTTMLPFFDLTQELYLSALARTYNMEYKSDIYPQIDVMAVNMQQCFNGGMTSGHVAVIKISKSELNGDRNCLSPYDYIGKYDSNGFNEPLLMYTRDLGMIINYETGNEWTKGIEAPEGKDTYLFSFYVPNTGKTLRSDMTVPKYAGIELGEYLRDCEASDHMGWSDRTGMKIVSKIQKNIINQIKNRFAKPTSIEAVATVSKLSNRLGRKLLPQVGYGRRRVSGNGSGGDVGGRCNDVEFKSTGLSRAGNMVHVDFELKLMQSQKDADIALKIASEGGWIDSRSWHNEIGTPFPASITSCVIHTMSTGANPSARDVDARCDVQNLCIIDEDFDITMSDGIDDDACSSIHVDAHTLNLHLKGTISIVTRDTKYRLGFKFE